MHQAGTTGIKIQGTPFVPGIASGTLQRGQVATEPSILLLPYQELERLAVMPAGLIVINASPLAHPMIRLYSYGVPTVIVSTAQAARLQEGAHLLLDAYHGLISDIDQSRSGTPPQPEPPTAGLPIQSRDGAPVELRASVPDAAGAAQALDRGACTIGMVRSEFLEPSDGRTPDDRFYYEALLEISERAAPLPVTVRLLDLAPDKQPKWLRQAPIAGMSGPLGLRGARLYAHEPVSSVFRAELAALARLCTRHELRVMLPYMTRVEEYPPLRQLLQESLGEKVPLGVMIETPAAALALRDWLELVDFVIIGCNDLMQCLFAADRDIPEVAPLLDPYTPVLYRLLHQMAQEAGGEIHRVQLGGLLPMVPGILPLLIGLGYRNFSVEPMLIPCLAELVSMTDAGEVRELAQQVCAARGNAEVRRLLELPENDAAI